MHRSVTVSSLAGLPAGPACQYAIKGYRRQQSREADAITAPLNSIQSRPADNGQDIGMPIFIFDVTDLGPTDDGATD